MSRPTLDRWALDLAAVVATRGTCARRQVGCVLMDARGHILATGYNGPAAALPHCRMNDGLFADAAENVCHGHGFASGQGLDACQAIHAEQNALLQCRDVSQIFACYVTVSPCVTCVKMLLNTSCQRVVFATPYADAETARRWWTSGPRSREWIDLKSF